MSHSSPSVEAPFGSVLEALLDADSSVGPQLLFSLSDIEGKNLAEFSAYWPRIPLWRRLALLEDMERLVEENNLLSFEAVCRIALKDEDPQARFLAVRSLITYEAADLIDQFIGLLRNDPDTQVRAMCAASLGHYIYLGEIEEIPNAIKDKIVAQLLQVTQGEDDSEVRRRALESLGYATHKAVASLIKRAFDTGEENWITSALFAMGRSYDTRWKINVVQMLNHQLPAIRFEAARAAGELEISEAAPRLIELLDDTNSDVRLAAAWSLSQVGEEGAKEALVSLTQNTLDAEEAIFLDEALDNLLFNEDLDLFGLLDIDDADDDDE